MSPSHEPSGILKVCSAQEWRFLTTGVPYSAVFLAGSEHQEKVLRHLGATCRCCSRTGSS